MSFLAKLVSIQLDDYVYCLWEKNHPPILMLQTVKQTDILSYRFASLLKKQVSKSYFVGKEL